MGPGRGATDKASSKNPSNLGMISFCNIMIKDIKIIIYTIIYAKLTRTKVAFACKLL